ncbi:MULTISPECIES: Na+/H+ antiporter subunit B [unclassified Cognatiyoonia]|uniref:Na+/H+ antiporter subunit B n=1 Tax=unclassified Cognatiyoonia TaxID=2635977 RepID=UPI002A0D508B|nr:MULTISPECIES: Na+/H+ antiporter subunit B [unclassified Cognatiyoonia]MDX8349095.1 Na+/H+ antiporter subunit B [Cognatiyoonia sp. IB215446]MDX8352064.1 Na+/H+ antiporter subunit B [Cognatiyoonia sp. IB215182]
MNSVILIAGARLQVVLLLVFSAYMLLRGHNAPGGGFIGGLIAATGFVVYAIACGTKDARAALRFDPANIAGLGLGIALLAGVMAAIWGDALFTGQWLFIGETEDDKGLPLSTVLVFDVGVYLVVLGSVLSIVFALEETS